MKRNPYPGVTKVKDRHGKTRWRFRLKGCASCYIHGPYGSKEFEASYQAATLNKPFEIPKATAKPGTFDWLITQYMRTKTFRDLAPITKRNLSCEMERFRQDHGHRSVAGLKKKHVEALMEAKRETPAAANKLKKLVGRLCRYAINDFGYAMTDPTQGVKPLKMNADGYHTWTDAEISQFLTYHGEGSQAAIVLHLILYTGAAVRTSTGWAGIACTTTGSSITGARQVNWWTCRFITNSKSFCITFHAIRRPSSRKQNQQGKATQQNPSAICLANNARKPGFLEPHMDCAKPVQQSWPKQAGQSLRL